MISFVQAVSANFVGVSGSIPIICNPGNLLYIVVTYGAGGSGPSLTGISLDDGGADTFSQIGILAGLPYNVQGQFFSANIAGGAVVITATFSTPVSGAISVLEFSGCDTGSPLKSSTDGTATSGAIVSDTLSPAAAAGDLIVAGASNYFGIPSWVAGNPAGMAIPAGASASAGDGGGNATAEYVIAAGGETFADITPTGVAGGTQGCIGVAVFKPASGAAVGGSLVNGALLQTGRGLVQ